MPEYARIFCSIPHVNLTSNPCIHSQWHFILSRSDPCWDSSTSPQGLDEHPANIDPKNLPFLEEKKIVEDKSIYTIYIIINIYIYIYHIYTYTYIYTHLYDIYMFFPFGTLSLDPFSLLTLFQVTMETLDQWPKHRQYQEIIGCWE
jgi:hypothetical protein